MKQKLLTLLLMAFIPIAMMAHDCEVNGIYYNLNTGDNTASVTDSGDINTYSGSVTIPSTFVYNGTTYSVTSIGELAFWGCGRLTSVTIPSSVTIIEEFAFECCNRLTSITIPEGVTSIEEGAFSSCFGLTSITIPSSVTSIGKNAFQNCFGLTSVNISDIAAWCNISFGGGESNPLYIAHKLYLNGELVTNLVIPEGVTSIGHSAFEGCSGLTSITIPSSVTSIGNSAFYNCSGLTSITIPSSVTSIGNGAFSGCSGLTSVTIPNSVTSIGYYAFPQLIKTIWLANTPPSGYTNASGLINYVPNNQYSSLNNRYEYPFLSSIFEVGGIKYVPVSPSERTCDAIDCLYDKSSERIQINSTVSFKGVNMTVKEIRPYTCYGNHFIKDVQLKNEGNVGMMAFYDCDSIINVKLENVGYVGEKAFSESNGILSVTASNNGNIGNSAFYGCTALSSVELSNKGNLGDSAFVNCRSIANVKAFNEGHIGKRAFYGCTALLSVELSNKGDVEESAFENCIQMTTAKVENQGSIGNNAFKGCSSLKTCTLGNEVTAINQGAFMNCENLQEIMIPDKISVVGENVFSGCTGLQSVAIGNGTNTIGSYAFSGCSSLTDMQIGQSVNLISTYAFQNCSALTKIVIPASVTSLENYSFYGCNHLATVLIANRQSELKLGSNGSNPLFSSCPLDSVYIGGNITYSTSSNDGYSPFYRNTSLRSVVFTDKETEISINEFYGCTNLKNVKIGDGVKKIGDWAFSGCSSLDYFAFGSKLETIGKEAFSDCTEMTKIISDAKTPPVCGSNALDDINKWNCTLQVPKGCLSAYQAADQWKDFFFVEEHVVHNVGSKDVNSDGSVDLTDALVIVDYILGRYNPDDSHTSVSYFDVNVDGSIDLTDALIIIDYILGRINPEDDNPLVSYLTCPDDHHPHLIDLGLPSGTKWACCNVGATTPEGYGGYYAWGETEEKDVYDWTAYKDLVGDIAGTQYDVAHVKWGGSWVMPSCDQQAELLENCSSEWTTFNGINGRVFTGSNGGSIFLPAAGCRYGTDLYDAGSEGLYWSSTLVDAPVVDEYHGSDLRLDSGDTYCFSNNPAVRQSVRPVASVTGEYASLLLSSSELSLIAGNEGTVDITSGSGTYTVASSDTGVATATLTGNTVKVTAIAAGTATITVTDTKSGQKGSIAVTVSAGQKSYLTCPDDHHPHLIDLGLPSGTKWACCNVGATTPEGYGGYYAWGETEEKTTYYESNYKYYHKLLGSVIAGTQYDVAHVKWGGSWVMPSYDQQNELLENCSSEWTTVNGVTVRKFTGSNGGSIYLPAAGIYWNIGLDGAGSDGYYWSSTQSPSHSDCAYNLNFDSGDAYTESGSYRSNGQSVRPVASN